MEATIVLVLLLGLVLGGMLLMLASGYVATEEARARQGNARYAEAARANEVLATSGFFEGLDGNKISPPPLVAFDDALLAQLESHVRAEQAIVTQFVRYPSVDSLYRQEGPQHHVH